MSAFFPSDPSDRHRTQAELKEWKDELERRKKIEKRETIRFWVTTVIAAVAALAAVAGVVLQLVLAQ